MNKLDKIKAELSDAQWKYSAITHAIGLTDKQEIWPIDEDDNLLVMSDLLEVGEVTGGTVIDYNPSSKSEDATGCIFLVKLPKSVDELYIEIFDRYMNTVRAHTLVEAAEFFNSTGDNIVYRLLNSMADSALNGEPLFTEEDIDCDCTSVKWGF